MAPHPDDEIIGAAALIRALKRQGTRVAVVVVSDGAASHPASLRWPARRLVAARRRESLRALRRLAIMADAVTFLGLPDGALPQQAVRCRHTLRRAVAMRRRLDLIVGPADSDAHPDHRAVAAALHGVSGKARRLHYQVWPPRSAASARGRTVAMRGGHATKRSLIRLHRTQMGVIRDDPTGFSIARHELAAFAHPIETYVEVPR
ncbi:PIG-L family deacetylase [uncultured Sphingomonas sp.]|uniref:PIG-L deacetylase family protein n=1 Tax=uncultured Sphingomonas sp. TaxID=158754 RepID=UPI0025F008D8|nr:PIG-L family deacetylase [uncultured Sphingomonas sp.]